MTASTLICDTECYRGYWLWAAKRAEDGQILTLELSDRSTIDAERLRKIMRKNLIVTFNGLGYDVPMIYYALKLIESGSYTPVQMTSMLKSASDRLIKGGVKWWDAHKVLDVDIPSRLDHIDLIEPQPNPFAKLKLLNGRMHGRKMQDLPFDPDHAPTHDDMDALTTYCINDLDATELLFKTLQEPLEMRKVIGDDLGVDLRSKSDTQMGLAIIKNRAEKLLRRRIEKTKIPAGTAFKYKAPHYLAFETSLLADLFERIQKHEFVVGMDGKVDLPDFLADTPIALGESTYQMGIGGLHSTESNRAVLADDDHVLIDADVGSYYPAIILNTGLFPPAIGKDFESIYQGVRADRMAAKIAKDKTRDKGLKIALNGVFGSLGQPHAIVYAPHLMIATTLTGQLALLMLIERLERDSFSIVSANTDGIVIRCHREDFNGFIEKDGKPTVRLASARITDIVDQWEADTGFDLEFVEYSAVYSQSVNSYFAIKADGGHKRKGPYGNPWSDHPDDKDARQALMKNPQMTICSDAALNLIKHGTPIEETIRACTDIRQFITVIRATKGATWRGDYLGEVVRYYWSKDGADILDAKPHATTGNFKKVAGTEGSAPCMELPDALPDDLDYDRYIEATREILMNIGFTNRPPPPPKLVRFTKANTVPNLIIWALAA